MASTMASEEETKGQPGGIWCTRRGVDGQLDAPLSRINALEASSEVERGVPFVVQNGIGGWYEEEEWSLDALCERLEGQVGGVVLFLPRFFDYEVV